MWETDVVGNQTLDVVLREGHPGTVEAAEQNHKFADEVTGTRHPQGSHREEHGQRWQPFNFAPQAPHHTHVAGMQTFVQLTAQDEEAGCGQTVRNHLDHRALVRQLAAGVDSNQHEAHVGNGCRRQSDA